MMMLQRPIGRRMISISVLLAVLLAISIKSSSAASIVQTLDRINDESSGEWNSVDDYRKAVLALKRVLANAKDPKTDELMTPFRKRTCYFNAGMSHSCDYKELLKSVDEANYWSSEYTPGRRRKRTQPSAATDATAPINKRRSAVAATLTAARRGELPSSSSSSSSSSSFY